MDSEIQRIQDHYLSWTESRRRGLVALTGDRGSEKVESWIDWSISWSMYTLIQNPCLSESSMSHPEIERQQALQWMNESLGLELEEVSQRNLISALSDLPPRVIAVDDLHQVFRRSVGGFSGLVALLEVMFATSEEHFWLASFA